jgi:uncharacterized membrane protein
MKYLKITPKSEAVPVLFIIATFVLAAYNWQAFPEIVPIHWNLSGQADNFGPGKVSAIGFPLVMVGIYALFLLLPFFDPKQEKYEQFQKPYHIIKAVLVVFCSLMYLATSLYILGYPVRIEQVMPLLIGILFVVLGNYMGKLKINWFIGVKTPWTLSSEEVWNKTHRFSGKLFVLSGFLMMAQAWLPEAWRMPVFIIMIAVLLGGTIGYSYLAYVRQDKKDEKTTY